MANETKNKKHFFKDFKAELKKVIWPTPKQLINSTVAVIVIVLITSAIVFVLDLVFDLMNNYGINKLKTMVQKNVSNTVIVNEMVENNINLIEDNTIVVENEVQE